jgi:hypothetical protein
MMSAPRALVGALVLLLLAGGLAAVACARWTRPIADGDALAAGDPAARAAYAIAEARFDRVPVLRQILKRDYARRRRAALDRRPPERYDAVIEKAQHSPDEPRRIRAGLAFTRRAAATEAPGQFAWLTRAEEELRRAVEAAPDDWDTKYDYELVTRLASALRKQPKVPPNQLMQLLRPQPRATVRPGRHVG